MQGIIKNIESNIFIMYYYSFWLPTFILLMLKPYNLFIIYLRNTLNVPGVFSIVLIVISIISYYSK